MTEHPLLPLLRRSLASVEERIQAACARAGRRREEITLVAVTKTVSAEVARLVPQLGVYDLGESRPQELWRKAAALEDVPGVRWHQIGHLQRNKVERTLPLVHCIHSVDSLRLLEALEQEARRTDRTVPIFLEINASGEEEKHGFAPEALPQLKDTLGELTHLHALGLMTMAAYTEDPEATRPTFALLRRLREQLQQDLGQAHPMNQLSMGMSNDFEVAIEEGATSIRLGTILFAEALA
jgi:pyridoxal phosphate enzyme (YggS family)